MVPFQGVRAEGCSLVWLPCLLATRQEKNDHGLRQSWLWKLVLHQGDKTEKLHDELQEYVYAQTLSSRLFAVRTREAGLQLNTKAS